MNGYRLFYGITPPKRTNSLERLQEIAAVQSSRIESLAPDALVVYDIQDESARITNERPFPFLETLAPEEYCSSFLTVQAPAIIYQSVGKYTPESFGKWLQAVHPKQLVLVGAPSKQQQLQCSLANAYALCKELLPETQLGGIVIPERHTRKGDEHERVWNKIEAGCSFFISQCVYSLESTYNFLSDYKVMGSQRGKALQPIIFTLTPCASEQTMAFMEWLGISIPNWIKNELLLTDNMLEVSVERCLMIAQSLSDFCIRNDIPFGFNIESVSIRKQEIEASMHLFLEIKHLLEKLPFSVNSFSKGDLERVD